LLQLLLAKELASQQHQALQLRLAKELASQHQPWGTKIQGQVIHCCVPERLASQAVTKLTAGNTQKRTWRFNRISQHRTTYRRIQPRGTKQQIMQIDSKWGVEAQHLPLESEVLNYLMFFLRAGIFAQEAAALEPTPFGLPRCSETHDWSTQGWNILSSGTPAGAGNHSIL